MINDGVILVPKVVVRWIDDSLDILAWLCKEIQASFEVAKQDHPQQGNLDQKYWSKDELIRGYAKLYRVISMGYVIGLIVFLLKLDDKNFSAGRLRHLIKNLMRSFPDGTTPESTLLQKPGRQSLSDHLRGSSKILPVFLAGKKQDTMLFHEAAKSYLTSNFQSTRAVFALLLQCNANPSTLDEQGNSPLHILAQELQKSLDKLPSAIKTSRRKTALSREDIVLSALLLLQHGAHADTRNQDGEVALTVFRKFDSARFDVFSYVKLQCLAARVLRRVNYPTELLPKDLIAFVSQH
jgi:hypothetical protein